MCGIILMRSIHSQKGQIRLFESIAVLLVLVFLFVFGIQYYAGVQKNAYERMSDQFNRLDSIKAANQIMSSPFLVCSTRNIRSGLCLDKYKLQAVSDPDADIPWPSGVALMNIRVEQTYPSLDSWQITNYQPAQNVSSFATQFPVVIYDPFTFTNTFGFIEIRTYASR